MKLAITVCATEQCAYALSTQARRVQANKIQIAKGDGHIIIVGDNSAPVKNTVDLYQQLMPDWNVIRIPVNLGAPARPYTQQNHLWIAQMRTQAFSRALALDVDYCWSLDSDVLPPYNAFDCMKTMLEFDNGYYDVATCPYPNTAFIGGRGTLQHPIAPDFYDDEREIPEDFKKKLDANEEALKKNTDELRKFDPPAPEKDALVKPFLEERKKLIEEARELNKQMREFPPKGNVFAMNALRWRKRGWMEHAYPGIGKGAIVPSDWSGFGCNLIGGRALRLCQFDGYDGGGTEDLYVNWHRWFLNSARICAIPHCLCDHVKVNMGYEAGKNGKYVLIQCYHEPDGECEGHIRTRTRPFYVMEPGEKYDEKNDGIFSPPIKSEKK